MKNYNGIIGLIVGMLLYFAVSGVVESYMTPTLDETLVSAANELNKNCPMMVDSETRLDNSTALPGHKFQYNYTLINFLRDSIDLPLAEQGLKKELAVKVKESPELEYFRKNNTTMYYSYKDKEGAFLFKIELTPQDYNSK